MNVERVRVVEVLTLDRVPLEPGPDVDHITIGVRSFGKGIFHYEPKPGAQLGSLRFYKLEPNRLVISNIKGWEGAVAVSGDADVGCLASSRFLTYSPIDGRIDVEWARWFFLSEAGLPLIQRASPGSADRNRTLAIDRFENLEIPLPPIDDQRRVADELGRLEDVANELRLRGLQASTLTEALSVSTCARPDLSNDAKIHEGWRQVELGSVMAPALDGVRVEADRNYPNLGIFNFGRGVFEKPMVDGGSSSAKTLYRVRAGQFIYSRLFAFEGAYAFVPPNFDRYFVSNEFPTFDPDPEQLDARWLASYLRSASRWSELAGSSKGLGVRRQRIPVEAILGYRVWLPPIDQQRSMVAVLERLESAQTVRREARARIDSLVPAALNRAFVGLS